MQQSPTEKMFIRALRLSFSKQLFFWTLLSFIPSAITVVFCRPLMEDANTWLNLALVFIPFFVWVISLSMAGIFITRVYHHRVKEIEYSLSDLYLKSKTAIIEVLYFSVPILILFTFVWAILGFFFLLQSLPAIGNLIFSLLAAVPLLLLFCCVAFLDLSFCVLFFSVPTISLGSKRKLALIGEVVEKFQLAPLLVIKHMLVASLPLVLLCIYFAVALTLDAFIFPSSQHIFYTYLQLISFMLLIALTFTPAVIFFFNFATESHVYFKKTFGLGKEHGN
ncbi:MAG: hypothetical protein L7U87_00935 [Chlamydiales bacterium]|nr:hypothetical protein [Chlamydiales bacterium]